MVRFNYTNSINIYYNLYYYIFYRYMNIIEIYTEKMKK